MASSGTVMERFKALMGDMEMPKPKAAASTQSLEQGTLSKAETVDVDEADTKNVQKSIASDADDWPDLPVPAAPVRSNHVKAEDTQVASSQEAASVNDHFTHLDLESTVPSRHDVQAGPVAIASESSEQSTSASHVPTTELDPHAAEDQDEPPADMLFCPVLALSRLPYRYLPHLSKEQSLEIAHALFDEGKFWARTWKLYYVCSPLASGAKPIALVSESQARELVDAVATAFPQFKVQFPDEEQHQGFVISFPSTPDLRPQWLGNCSSRATYDTLLTNAKLTCDLDSSELAQEDLELFRTCVENAIDAAKPRSKSATLKRDQERQNFQTLQLTTSLRQFGLSTYGDSEHVFDSSFKVQHDFADDAIFISVDVESFEFSHDKVTEVGISTIDTRDLRNVAPGPRGIDWRPLIRSRHFRISEYAHLINRRYVKGCPDAFDFGNSEFVPLRSLPKVIADCFKQPFSARSRQAVSREERNIVFVGHDAKTDISYLRKIGYDVTNLRNLKGVLDTAPLYTAHMRLGKPNPPSLGKIIHDMDMTAWNLHNAGNDAVYTLQCVLALVVSEAERGPFEAAAAAGASGVTE